MNKYCGISFQSNNEIVVAGWFLDKKLSVLLDAESASSMVSEKQNILKM